MKHFIFLKLRLIIDDSCESQPKSNEKKYLTTSNWKAKICILLADGLCSSIEVMLMVLFGCRKLVGCSLACSCARLLLQSRVTKNIEFHTHDDIFLILIGMKIESPLTPRHKMQKKHGKDILCLFSFHSRFSLI